MKAQDLYTLAGSGKGTRHAHLLTLVAPLERGENNCVIQNILHHA